MPVNLIAEDKGEGNGVCKIDEEGSRLSGRGKDGSEPPGLSSANAGFFGAHVLLASESASGAIQFHRTSP